MIAKITMHTCEAKERRHLFISTVVIKTDFFFNFAIEVRSICWATIWNKLHGTDKDYDQKYNVTGNQEQY